MTIISTYPMILPSMDDQHYAETLILTAIVAMMVLYGLVAIAAAWAERPLVTQDPDTGYWRSARLVAKERQRR